jgi:hypothetical protein
MQPVKIAGALVATTKDIEQYKRLDDSEGGDRDHMLSWAEIRRLDPDGYHILCTRPEGLPGLAVVGKEKWTGDLTLGSPLHFQGLFKLAGQKSPTERWITLTVAEAILLEPVARNSEPALEIRMIDAETQLP